MTPPLEVFYTPHTDDESIAMAGAIHRARKINRDVMVVLVSDNEASERGAGLFPGAPVQAIRLEEWRAALVQLDVTHTEQWNIREQDIVRAPFSAQDEIERRMADLHARLAPVHHHTVWGMHDVSFNGRGSLAHGLCANALTRIAYRKVSVRATLYAVYIYARDLAERCAPVIRTLTEDEMAAKRNALDCYRDGHAYGYKSVPELIDGAFEDPHEYLVEVAP